MILHEYNSYLHVIQFVGGVTHVWTAGWSCRYEKSFARFSCLHIFLLFHRLLIGLYLHKLLSWHEQVYRLARWVFYLPVPSIQGTFCWLASGEQWPQVQSHHELVSHIHGHTLLCRAVLYFRLFCLFLDCFQPQVWVNPCLRCPSQHLSFLIKITNFVREILFLLVTNTV